MPNVELSYEDIYILIKELTYYLESWHVGEDICVDIENCVLYHFDVNVDSDTDVQDIQSKQDLLRKLKNVKE